MRIIEAPADFDQWDELLALILAAFASMDGVIDPPSSAHRLTPAALRARAAAEVLLLAMEGDRLLGCAFLAKRPDCAYLGKLAVLPACQGQGIGRALTDRAERMAMASGLSMLELETRVELLANHAAFGRLGFVEIGRTAHPGFSRPTSIRMRKLLPATA